MSNDKQKTTTVPAPAPAATALIESNPAAGGCYVRDPVTGELSVAQPPATSPIPAQHSAGTSE